MGNARWTGVRLRDLLARAGLRAGAQQVVFDGLDDAPLPGTPDFVKVLDFGLSRGADERQYPGDLEHAHSPTSRYSNKNIIGK